MTRDDMEALCEPRALSIEETSALILSLHNKVSGLEIEAIEQDIIKKRHISNCRILAQKLKEKAPDLEDWLNANFGEYLQ